MFSLRRRIASAAGAAPIVRAIAPVPRISSLALRCFSQGLGRRSDDQSTEPLSFDRSAFRRDTLPEPRPSKAVYVTSLPHGIEANKVQEAFERFGEIQTFQLREAGTHQSFGAFVLYKSLDSAAQAIEGAHNCYFEGRKIYVRPYIFKNDRTGETPFSHRQRRDAVHDYPPSKTIFVGNLPFEISDEDLAGLFEGLDGVKALRASTDRSSGRFTGSVHVDFETIEAASAAIELLNGKDIGGRPTRSNFARVMPKELDPVQSSEAQEGEIPPP